MVLIAKREILIRHIMLIGLLLLFGACRTFTFTESEPDFLLIERDKEPKLMRAALAERINVCLIAQSAAIDATQWKPDVEKAILAWVDSLRKISDKQLAGKIDVTIASDCLERLAEYDTVISLAPGDSRSYHIASQGLLAGSTTFYVGDVRGYTVLLHELGHGMGLNDTYTSGLICQQGQPPSVMCNANFQTLQRDDMTGVRVVFASFHYGLLTPFVRERFRTSGLQDFTPKWLIKSAEEQSLLDFYQQKSLVIGGLEQKISDLKVTAAPDLAVSMNALYKELDIAKQNAGDLMNPRVKLENFKDRVELLRSIDLTDGQIAVRLNVAESVVAHPETFLTPDEFQRIDVLDGIVESKLKAYDEMQKKWSAVVDAKVAPFVVELSSRRNELQAIDDDLGKYRKSRNELFDQWLPVVSSIFSNPVDF